MPHLAHILAAYGDAPSPWPGRLIAFFAIAILIIVPVMVLRSRRRALSGQDASADIYAGITGVRQPDSVGAGEVHVIFRTYSGFIVYAVQRTHDVVLPADQAKILLGRMLKHNCTRGLLERFAFSSSALSRT